MDNTILEVYNNLKNTRGKDCKLKYFAKIASKSTRDLFVCKCVEQAKLDYAKYGINIIDIINLEYLILNTITKSITLGAIATTQNNNRSISTTFFI